jgi:RNA polymerase sigma factor (sigma-70 family)
MSTHRPKIVVLRPAPGQSPSDAGSHGDAGVPTLDEVIGRHLDALYANARLLTGNAAAADDLVQETALQAHRSWGGLRRPAAVNAWLFRILYRAHLGDRRRARRQPPLVDLDIDELLEHPILGHEPELPHPGGNLSEEVALGLASLPPGFREALWLVDVEELTIAQTAEVMDVPPGTVASRLYRARRMLREALVKKQQGGGRP